MKEKIILGLICMIIGITISTLYFYNNKKEGYIPLFKIVGDVGDCITLKNVDDIKHYDIEYKEFKYNAVKLKDIINKAKPITQTGTILLVGNDDLVSEINIQAIDDCYINFSKENGWEAINLKHPVSSNLKHIKEIVIVSDKNNFEYGLNIFTANKNIVNLTYGQLYKEGYEYLLQFEGKSKENNDGNISDVSVYTSKKIISLYKNLGISEGDKLLVINKEGKQEIINGGRFELNENYINYVYPDNKSIIEDLIGIIVNPPSSRVTDTYYDSLHFIENNDKVMILFLDGFGYHQYLSAVENGKATFLSSINSVKPAVSVFKPVTNTGFAAMITGKTPDINGVHNRKNREMSVKSIFGILNDRDKESVLIEGNIKILNTEVEPILNVDKNKNGTTDDEIFDTAIKHVDEDIDLLFVHFHGIDDRGHSYGDISSETMEHIKIIDGYVKELVQNWNGKVIITSDHGMHKVENHGDHGQCRFEDMIVPYVITKGGK